jgi:hypothetical protein
LKFIFVELGTRAKLTREITLVKYIGVERQEETKPLYKWISSHIAKRTYVNMFFRGGGRMESIMMTAGNSDRKTMKHYLEIDNKEIRREVDSIFNNVKL